MFISSYVMKYEEFTYIRNPKLNSILTEVLDNIDF